MNLSTVLGNYVTEYCSRKLCIGVLFQGAMYLSIVLGKTITILGFSPSSVGTERIDELKKQI